MKVKLLVIGFGLAVAVFAAGPAKKILTHEDLWLMKRVGAPVPSPDGSRVVFTVTEPAYDPKEQSSDLWLKSLADDSPARKITFTKSAESGVAWSPDGTRLAFAAKRDSDEAAQIYVLNLEVGGEAERITALTLGARQPKWSPDGRALLFVSDTFPGCADEEANKKAAKERKNRKYNVRAYETFPVRFWDHWLDDKHAHLFAQEAKPGASARDLFAGSKLAASPGFGGQFDESGEAIEAEWTPDGAGVVFTAVLNRDESARAYVHTQIFLVAAAGGEPRALTGDTSSYGALQFAPDGKALLCTTTDERAEKVYGLTRLARFPWPFDAAKRIVLTAKWDRSVSRFAQVAGSPRIWLTGEEAGQENLFVVEPDGGITRIAAEAGGCFGGLAAGGATLVATWDSATNPAEIFTVGIADGKRRRRTNFNVEKAAALDLPPLEHFWTPRPAGPQLHSLLVRPPGFDPQKKYPLFVVIHGGAANMWKDSWGLRWNYHLLAAPGYVLVLTDYKGSTGYGEAFSQAIQFDPLAGPAEEINAAADEAVRKFPFIDGSRQAAGGASYGGHLANWLQATTTRYKCIISHAGEMDLVMQWGTSDSIYGREVNSGTPVWGDSKVWREQSPVLQGGNHAKGTGFVTPILITVGELDFRVPMNNALMNFATQQRLKVPSKLLVFPDAGHWILRGEDSRHWFGEVHAWLAQWLK